MFGSGSKKSLVFVFALAVCFLFMQSAFAQSTAGITGTVSDATGATGSMTTTTLECLPPEPAWQLVYPQAGATGVPTSFGKVWAAVLGSGVAVIAQIPVFYARLIGSDGSVITSGQFSVTTASPPPGSATLPSGYTYATASVPSVAPSLSYNVQFADLSLTCLPPLILGAFST